MVPSIFSFRDLDAYKKAYQLALQTCLLTRRLPAEERHGLSDQLRRAAISIPSNIAEGYRRRSRTDYIRFLRIAFGSCGELQTQIELCRDMEIIGSDEHERISALGCDVSKLLYRLIESLQRTQ